MPNTKGGKNYKKGKKAPEPELNVKRIPLVGPDTIYVTMVKIAGGNMTEVRDMSGHTYVGVIPGSMRKRVFINPGDILLIQRRQCSTHDHKYDIIYKYSSQEVKYLQSIGEIHFEENHENDSQILFTNEETVRIEDIKVTCNDVQVTSDEESTSTDQQVSTGPKGKYDRDKRVITLDEL